MYRFVFIWVVFSFLLFWFAFISNRHLRVAPPFRHSRAMSEAKHDCLLSYIAGVISLPFLFCIFVWILTSFEFLFCAFEIASFGRMANSLRVTVKCINLCAESMLQIERSPLHCKGVSHLIIASMQYRLWNIYVDRYCRGSCCIDVVFSTSSEVTMETAVQRSTDRDASHTHGLDLN